MMFLAEGTGGKYSFNQAPLTLPSTKPRLPLPSLPVNVCRYCGILQDVRRVSDVSPVKKLHFIFLSVDTSLEHALCLSCWKSIIQ